MKKLLSFLILIGVGFKGFNQNSFTFAHVSDTHIGSANADDDLRRTVANINADSTISFVVLTGDITDFGSDAELHLAKQILDSLQKPWHIIPGNHDANWSESGTNSFKKIFGSETFKFTHGGYFFVGTVCGPNMRMSPGQVSRENIVWLDSTLNNLPDKNMPVIFLNHYPQDTSLNNWYEVIDILKQHNTQLILCGHGHANHKLLFDGIPAVMGRSNLRAKQPVGGFNIVTIKDGEASYEVRDPLTGDQKKWAEVALFNHHFDKDTTSYYRPDFSMNKTYSNVKTVWQFNDNSDIGSGADVSAKLVIASNSNGQIYALNKATGKKVWSFATNGKVYSTPTVSGNYVVTASTDQFIYCLNVNTGKLVWKFETQKPDVANAVIKNNTVFIGGGDGHFRAIELATGKLKWDFDGVKSFVVSKPLFYKNKVYFGSWGTEFYALDAATGALAWKWNNGSSNRMFSPAAVYPVATNNRIFIVAPDRYMTVFNADNGNVIWRKKDEANRVRESMTLSKDSSTVFAKTMEGEVVGVSTTADSMQVTWNGQSNLSYEIAPTALVEANGIVFVPSNSGVVAALNRNNGTLLWKHKISNALVTNITPVLANSIVVTTMDGKVTCLKF